MWWVFIAPPLISQLSLASLSERCTVPSTCWWFWPRSIRLRCWQASPPSWPSSLSASSARPSPFPLWWSVRLELLEFRECALVCVVVPCSQNEIVLVFTWSSKAEITTVHPPFLRRDLYPLGGAGYRLGRDSDAKAEPLCERSQQTVHHCCGAQLVCCHTFAALWLLHPEGRRSLSTQVAWNVTFNCIKFLHTPRRMHNLLPTFDPLLI